MLGFPCLRRVMKFLGVSLLTLIASWASIAGGVRVPNADTPLFYFVSTSTSTTDSSNLLPLHIKGGTNDFAALSGTASVGKHYFWQGRLVAQDPAGTSTTYRPYVSATLTGSGCTPYGPLGFIQGSTSNKCASFLSFQIQSDGENSQLGAKLVFNYVGGFYACGATKDVWYKTDPSQGPSDCTPVDLFTVPVAPVS